MVGGALLKLVDRRFPDVAQVSGLRDPAFHQQPGKECTENWRLRLGVAIKLARQARDLPHEVALLRITQSSFSPIYPASARERLLY